MSSACLACGHYADAHLDEIQGCAKPCDAVNCPCVNLITDSMMTLTIDPHANIARREGLRELVRMSEDAGGYPELDTWQPALMHCPECRSEALVRPGTSEACECGHTMHYLT